MATLKAYGKGSVYIDGKLLCEEVSVSADINPGHNPVKTVQNGLSGFSQGAAMTTVKIENVIPADGIEHDPSQYADKVNPKDIVIYLATKTLSLSAVCTDFAISHGEAKEATYSFTFVGGYCKFE